MAKINHFKYYKSSPEIIKLAIMYYVRYPLSLRNIEDILHERGINICHETIRYWWNKLGPIVARELKKKREHKPSNWRWHTDEVFVKINGKLHYLWRAIDHEGTVLDCYVTKRRDKKAAKKVLRKLVSKYGKPKEIVTDKLKSYRAGMRDLNMVDIHETQQYKNNQVENSHLHFRRREKMMNKFRLARSLQKFTAIQSVFQNHFNHQRHIEKRQYFKDLRQTSVDVWNELLIA
tara:strand:- start:2727 stop:3425 length:699 start_codon:yes stop_codon:yes gene_type:complete